jgi:hypothetical protein
MAPAQERNLERAIRDLHPGLENIAVPYFNDTHSHSDVLAIFDTAIENEQARIA